MKLQKSVGAIAVGSGFIINYCVKNVHFFEMIFINATNNGDYDEIWFINLMKIHIFQNFEICF